MRRSASEIIRNLEMRVARLENKTSSRDLDLSGLAQFIAKEFSRSYESNLRNSQDVETALHEFFQGFTDFFDGEDEWAEEDGVYDLIFEVKDYEVSRRTIELTILVHHVFGNDEVKFETSLSGRNVVVKKASSSRLAVFESNEDFQRGDRVMLLTVKPGQAGSYANPGMVETVMGDKVRVSVGMASLIVSETDLVHATGRKDENIKIWRANYKG